MFVRCRENSHRLHLSLLETRRISGKVRRKHFASLGFIEIPQTIPGRLTFWQGLHEQLARLENRLTSEAQGKVRAAVHARVPMVTPEEQRALQLENAKGRSGCTLDQAGVEMVPGAVVRSRAAGRAPVD
jgi:hypothetical protein